MMTHLIKTRRGFTLVELLIVMVLLSIVGAAIVRSLTTAARASQTQAEKTAMQSNLRAGAEVVPSELRELNIDGTGSDVVAYASDSITYRAMRRLGMACNATTRWVLVRNTNTFGVTDFAVGDSLMIYIEGNDFTGSDDSWEARSIGNIGTGTCPDGSAGTLLTIRGGATDIPAANMQMDAPIRSYQLTTLKVYASGGQWWLGMRIGNGTMEPVLGPLTNATNTFTYRNATGGGPPASNTDIRVIETWLHGQTSSLVSSGYESRHTMVDSLRSRIRLRNAP